MSRFVDRFGELEPDKPAHRLWPALDVAAADLFVDKCRLSAFIHGSSKLHDLLVERHIDTLIIVGTFINLCCESTARDAMMVNYRVLMVDDANATLNEMTHRATLDTIFTYLGDAQSTEKSWPCSRVLNCYSRVSHQASDDMCYNRAQPFAQRTVTLRGWGSFDEFRRHG